MENTTAKTNLRECLGYITDKEYAALLGVKLASVRNRRSLGYGPDYTRVGGRIYYSIEAVKAYFESQTVSGNRPDEGAANE